MPVCRFFQQGNCRNGDNCRFEHPGRNAPSTGNRFGPLAGTSAMGSMNNRGNDPPPYGLSEDLIRRDLENELPSWLFSAYGPGRDAPEQLFGGPAREQSAEEIRWHYLQAAASGNPQQAVAEVDAMYQAAQQQIRHTLSNINQAIQFIADAANKHPNRLDICKAGTQTGGAQNAFAQNQPQQTGAFGSTSNAFATATPSSNPFGAPAASSGGAFGAPAASSSSPFGAPAAATGSAFGQASALGQKPSPFGAPAFGQPAQPAAASAFGQPSALGSTSAFGRPAQTAGAFGQTSALGAKPSPFGTPAFGQPAGGTAFGQPSLPAAAPAPAFGQTSQPAAGGSVFGQPSQPVSAFGQTSQPTSAFGQASALGQKPNPFGAPAGASPFAAAAQQQQPSANPFGQPASTPQTSSPFGQPAASAPANPFGQQATPSPFGAPAAAPASSSPFGQPQPAQQQSNPFGAPAAQAPAASNPFGQPATSSPFGAPAAQPSQPAANPFGQPASQPAAASAFGGGGAFGSANTAPAAATPAPTGPAAHGQGPYPSNASRQHPDPSSYSSKGPDNRLRMWKGRPVRYVPEPNTNKEVPMYQGSNGNAVRIWFPDGPPAYTAETEAADPKVYDDPAVQQQWASFMQTGVFAGGMMPEVPPKRELCQWDF
ncbi:nucleoporin AMO1 [Podospora conica]|nr:nucleoporin AMO1 [Schizothecium conicum]